jgi:hypothetical protein
MRTIDDEQLCVYLDNNKALNVCIREIPMALANDEDTLMFLGMEYFCAVQHFEGYRKGYEAAIGKQPDCYKAGLIYWDTEKDSVDYPLEEIVILRD